MSEVDVQSIDNLNQQLMVYQEQPDNLTPSRVMDFVAHHLNYQRPRLQQLDAYYKGVNTKINDTSSRRVDDYGADVRLSHPFAQEIADFHTAFSVGNPISISVDQDENGKEDEHPQLDLINQTNDVDALFYDLFADMGKFGRSFAIVYRDEEDKVERFVRLDPTTTFIIYSDDIDRKPVAGVRYTLQNQVDQTGEAQTITDNYVIEIWTDNLYRISKPVQLVASAGETVFEDALEPESIPTMPIVEFWNNSQRMGDYENVLRLIDAYDASQSDTANYMQDSNDSMLVIQGDIQDLLEGLELTADPEDKEYMKELVKQKRKMLSDIRKSRTLFLKSGIAANGSQTNVNASYIHKEYDSAGVEAYKNRLYKNIHTFSRTPDMSDDNFASNSSGVAMQYKQLGVIQLAKSKRRLFQKGLSALYYNVQQIEQAVSGAWDLDYTDIKFMFTDNTPTDDVQTVVSLVQAGAQLPQEYLYRYAPGITADELNTMMEQQQKGLQDMQSEMVRLTKRDEKADNDDTEGDVGEDDE